MDNKKCMIEYEKCLLDEYATKYLEVVNMLAFLNDFEYFVFNGYVFQTIAPSIFNKDASYTGFEEFELVGYPTEEELEELAML